MGAPPVVRQAASGDAIAPRERRVAGNVVDAAPHREERVVEYVIDLARRTPPPQVPLQRHVHGVERLLEYLVALIAAHIRVRRRDRRLGSRVWGGEARAAGPTASYDLDMATTWRTTFRVGERTVHGVSDGSFTMREGFMNVPGFQRAYEDEDGRARLPIASFVVEGDQTVLIDAGVGPADGRTLSGGALLDELERVGVLPADVDLLAISHLHLDHDGWIATIDGEVVFPNATLRMGRADYELFVESGQVEGNLAMAPHLKAVLTELCDDGRIDFVEDDSVEIAPGVIAVPTPGHTPGHLAFAVRHGAEQLFILGDAMYCPEQLTDADLTAMHDVDPVLARRSRELIQREVDRHGTTAVGCHFPGLRGARVIGGELVDR